MEMEELHLHSTDSVKSAADFSHYQTGYEHTLFSDFGIRLDEEDSDCVVGFAHASQSSDFDLLHKVDFVSNSTNSSSTHFNESIPATTMKYPSPLSDLMSKRIKLSHGDPYTHTPNEIGPLKFFSEEENSRKRYPIGDSNSKNAIAARDNRLKKKQYVSQLEDTVKILRSDNKTMSKEVADSRSRLSALESEVHYLKSVIANQSTLSAILSNVSKTPGISLSTSFGNEVVKADEVNVHTSNSLSEKSVSKQYPSDRNLRPRTNLKSRALENKGVQNMSAEEIVQCCKEKKRKVHVSQSFDSESDSEVEVIDVGESSHKVKNKPQILELPLQKDYGGVCLHVSGTKVSLEFCASCNMKSKTDVSLDHSYSSYISNWK